MPRSLRPVPLLAVLALAALRPAPAAAFNPQPEPPGSSAFGIHESQVAQVDLVNVTAETPGLEPTTCGYRVRVLGAAGQTLLEQEVVARAGEIASVLYRPGAGESGRTLARVSVDLLGGSGRRMACDAGTRGSVELVQAGSGLTQLVLPLVTDFLPAEPAE